MAVHFKKYHGLGNDYLVIDPNVQDFEMTEANIRLICDRNFGVGSDGILYGPRSKTIVPVLRIFNPDGSEAEKSGNGLRIFAKYLFEKKYVRSKSFQIKTLGGIVDVQVQDKTANLIRINMGKVTFISNEIPVAGDPARGRERAPRHQRHRVQSDLPVHRQPALRDPDAGGQRRDRPCHRALRREPQDVPAIASTCRSCG